MIPEKICKCKSDYPSSARELLRAGNHVILEIRAVFKCGDCAILIERQLCARAGHSPDAIFEIRLCHTADERCYATLLLIDAAPFVSAKCQCGLRNEKKKK